MKKGNCAQFPTEYMKEEQKRQEMFKENLKT